MDNLDRQMIKLLQADGRMTLSELSKHLSLSRPSVSERLHRLQERNIITKFSACVSPAAVGRNVACLIQVNQLRTSAIEFEHFIKSNSCFLECHRVTGSTNYFLKAAVKDVAALEVLVDQLIPMGTINTSIILSSPVETRSVEPVEEIDS